ncbi:MAG: nucleoside triphosphate pyrophosphatase [Candidatus Hodarchaeota archaeon]
MKNIVLASKSTDRSELLKNAKIPFEVIFTTVNEEKYKQKINDPIKLVIELAKAKALDAKEKLRTNTIIIAADTIIELNGEIIGKAENETEAFNLLKKLINKSHNLITGIAITETNNPKIMVDYSITMVEFLDLNDKEIWNYIKTEEWKGRAGAYSIKDKASLFIKKIKGSPTNVIGLPMHRIFEILKKEFDYDLVFC